MKTNPYDINNKTNPKKIMSLLTMALIPAILCSCILCAITLSKLFQTNKSTISTKVEATEQMGLYSPAFHFSANGKDSICYMEDTKMSKELLPKKNTRVFYNSNNTSICTTLFEIKNIFLIAVIIIGINLFGALIVLAQIYFRNEMFNRIKNFGAKIVEKIEKF